ncbi:hypothetical protein FOA52_004945 [Chlamydomonas sp. UWO 241]|nr:hypothetical protein FOA52_004945 [Chlamydomonas sp. UWO 241]
MVGASVLACAERLATAALASHSGRVAALGSNVWAAGSGTAWGRGFAAEASDDITVDVSVAHRLKQLQAEETGKVVLRIEVEGGGCSGFNYKFKLDSAVNADDKVFERDGCQVVCDSVSFEFLKGATVVFEESLMRSAFVVSTNPNAELSCGCGTSFAAKM